ncbi:hypothetical protein [Dechloromonas denitrificans]|uniref:hypothetical protein n=1 Tax=Dechloromonas denitrificans TaxID=281362 RepID=UPI001CFAAFCF|nr:hypothetical protein [Dechloromonas denitrificans]UCV09391.1 hypothetical protein KI615_07710 [Dechloromonas denitrificans]
MKTIKNQVLAGTRLDSQGERNPKEVLESFCAMYAGKRMSMNQQHDLTLKSPGYIENLRVIPDKEGPGDWSLVGDVFYDGDSLQAAMGGFSISFLEVIRRGESQDLFHVYLPYPHYKDSVLVDELFEDGFVSVGRWAKKAADPATVALIGGVIVFIIKPVWEDLYKTQIAPHIYRFFSTKFDKLREKKIDAQFVQHVQYNNYEIQVLLIPALGSEEKSFGIDATSQAMALVHQRLTTLPAEAQMASKVYLQFDENANAYSIYRIEHKDGTLTESAQPGNQQDATR